jgi:hypothetical protein
MAWPKGIMATTYVIKEVLGFCIEHIQQVESTKEESLG